MERKYVYLMRGTKFMYKIGISNNPERRLKEVSHKPKLVAHYKFFYADVFENILHQFFNEKQRTRTGSGKTEWFRLGPLQIIFLHLMLLFFKIVHDASILFLLIAVVVGILYYIKH